jgi:hypothetical protein
LDVTEKICSSCKELKSFSEFTKQKDKKYGLSCACKNCMALRRRIPENRKKQSNLNKKYQANNSEYLKEKSKEYYYSNKESCLKNKKEYYENNKKEKIQKQKEYYSLNKEARNKYNKEYYKKNKKACRNRNNEWKKNKRKNDLNYKIYSNISNSIYQALTKNKNFKKWHTMVPYSLEELRSHLESKFTKGMTWENYGINGWHIDHIIPQSFFKYKSYEDEAFKACWALSNLQPLWATKEIAMSHGESDKYLGNFDKNNKICITEEMQEFLDSVNMKE